MEEVNDFLNHISNKSKTLFIIILVMWSFTITNYIFYVDEKSQSQNNLSYVQYYWYESVPQNNLHSTVIEIIKWDVPIIINSTNQDRIYSDFPIEYAKINASVISTDFPLKVYNITSNSLMIIESITLNYVIAIFEGEYLIHTQSGVIDFTKSRSNLQNYVGKINIENYNIPNNNQISSYQKKFYIGYSFFNVIKIRENASSPILIKTSTLNSFNATWNQNNNEYRLFGKYNKSDENLIVTFNNFDFYKFDFSIGMALLIILNIYVTKKEENHIHYKGFD